MEEERIYGDLKLPSDHEGYKTIKNSSQPEGSWY